MWRGHPESGSGGSAPAFKPFKLKTQEDPGFLARTPFSQLYCTVSDMTSNTEIAKLWTVYAGSAEGDGLSESGCDEKVYRKHEKVY